MSQPVINALVRQRDRAMNEAAQAEAQCEVLNLEVQRLTEEAEELRATVRLQAAKIDEMHKPEGTDGH